MSNSGNKLEAMKALLDSCSGYAELARLMKQAIEAQYADELEVPVELNPALDAVDDLVEAMEILDDAVA